MKKSDKKSDKLAEVHKALLKMQFLNTYYYSKVIRGYWVRYCH